MRTVSAQSVDIVFGQKVAEAEGIVRRLTAKLVEPGMYLMEQAHASAELLHLPNPVTVVELGCTIAFIKNPQTIVVLWKGWFFDAKRMR